MCLILRLPLAVCTASSAHSVSPQPYSIDEPGFVRASNLPLEGDERVLRVLRLVSRVHHSSSAYDCRDFLGGILVGRVHHHLLGFVQNVLYVTRAETVLNITDIVRENLPNVVQQY